MKPKKQFPFNVKVRYAVVGLGHIAQTAVLPAFKHAKHNSELVALVTGDPEKAKKLSKKYNVENIYSYESYGELLKSGLIDAVYICLPNNMHAEFAVKASKAGIHVLCEKPLTLNLEFAERMREAAHRSQKKLMTAYRLHFDPANLKAVEICKSGQLGELKYFTSDFSYQIADKNNIRVQKDKGGGPIWDIGIYCINATRYIFQAEPIEVFAFETLGRDERFNEVSESVTALLRFPNERIAKFTCSFGAANCSEYKVVGTKGSAALKNAYEYAVKRELELKIGDKKEKKFSFEKHDQFGPEIAYFSERVLWDLEIEPSAVEGMADIRVIRAVLESIKTKRPVSLRSTDLKLLRPNEKMRYAYPGIREPQKINVSAPSK